MNREDVIRGAFSYMLEGPILFGKVKEEIDTFLEKYRVGEWLSLNQVGMIHEILLSGERNTVIKRLDEYRKLQLKRTSEKDKWQREVNGKRAIDYFYELVDGLLDRHIRLINRELEKEFGFTIDNTYYPIIYQALIRSFDHIFNTCLRILKKGEACYV
ncbi:MAG: hypothetical protein IBX72_13865 [Nitrospirae bacterium]|nr:hypothetical protein [Nitrospirota bacterium]